MTGTALLAADNGGPFEAGLGVVRRHFVAVATGEYDHPLYCALPVADEVRQLREWISDAGRLGYRAFVHAYPELAKGPDEDAIRAAFRRPPRPWTERDAAVVLVTGHGQVADDTHWLVLRDSEPGELPSTAFRTADLISWLKRRNGIRHLLLIIDACFAGAIAREAIRIDDMLPQEWLILPSATKDGEATALALTTAIGQAVENLRGGEGERYGTNRRYFRVSDFVDTVRHFLDQQSPGQALDPIYRGDLNAEHVCLPNPHYRIRDAVPTRPARHELALPMQDLERHWAPRALGAGDSQQASTAPRWLFTGRATLMRELIATTRGDRDADGRVTLVTGSAGCGKSAVLARLVTLSDPDFAAAYPGEVEAVPPDLKPEVKTSLGGTAGGVDVAVVATGKYPHEVIGQLSDALGATRPEAGRGDADLASRIDALIMTITALVTPVTVVVDALDEAEDPLGIVRALTTLTQETALRLLVGVRAPGSLDDQLAVGPQGSLADRAEMLLSARRLRVDEDPWWRQDDVHDYALSMLLHTPSSMYQNPALHERARLLAAAIAGRVGRTFLVARLSAAALIQHPEPVDPADPSWLATLDEDVVGAFRADLIRAFPQPETRLAAVELLRAVAFANGKGLPWDEIWPLVASAVADRNGKFGDRDIAHLLASPISAYLATDIEHETTVYRLFHDALRGVLRARWRELLDGQATNDPDEAAVEARITGSLRTLIHSQNLANAPGYLLRSLPGHAQAAGMIDELLIDDAYLLHADLRRLLPAANSARSAEGRRRAKLLRLTPQAIPEGPAERAALFSVTEALEDLDTSFREGRWNVPYRARWARMNPRHERTFLTGHQGAVFAVCMMTLAGQPMLASGGSDGTVRIWDLATGQPHATINAGQGRVRAVCPVTVAGQPMLATYGDDATVRIWDLATSQCYATLEADPGYTLAMCSLTVRGQAVLATGGSDGTVRIWDLATGQPHATLDADQGGVSAMCSLTVSGQPMLATGGSDGTVRIWDLATEQPRATLERDQGGVSAMCSLTVSGQPMLATGGSDGTVRIWDLAAGHPHANHKADSEWVSVMCAVTVADQPMLATGGDDGTVRIWDLATDQPHAILEAPMGRVSAMCAVTVACQPMLATGGSDGTVRIWDLDLAPSHHQATLQGQDGRSTAVCTVAVGGQPMLAAGGDDGTVRIWDLATGHPHAALLEAHDVRVVAICAVTVAGQPMLAAAGGVGTMRIWDLATGQLHATLKAPLGRVTAICPVIVGGQPMLAGSGGNRTVRIWDLATGQLHATIKARQGRVHAVCPVIVAGQPMLATGGSDGTVRIWDLDLIPAYRYASLDGHQGRLLAMCPVTVSGQPMLATGDDDGTVRIWDPATGQLHATLLEAHEGQVLAMCPMTVSGRPMLATGGDDRTVRLWDPTTGRLAVKVLTHYPALGVAAADGLLGIAVVKGPLVIEIRDP